MNALCRETKSEYVTIPRLYIWLLRPLPFPPSRGIVKIQRRSPINRVKHSDSVYIGIAIQGAAHRKQMTEGFEKFTESEVAGDVRARNKEITLNRSVGGYSFFRRLHLRTFLAILDIYQRKGMIL